MSTHNLCGIKVEFPYEEPYGSQKALMARVIQALKQEKNALLESPTGSGKSLAILCSTLSWYTKHVIDNNNINDIDNGSQPVKIYFTTRTHSQITQLINEFRKIEYSSTIKMTILASRKHLCIFKPVIASSDKKNAWYVLNIELYVFKPTSFTITVSEHKKLVNVHIKKN